MLPQDYPPETLGSKFPAFVAQHLPAKDKIDPSSTIEMALEPLSAIHLYSGLDKQMKATSDVTYVYLFSLIACFILLIACINFTNLATARSMQRAKEVGLRKTLGAQRSGLIRQFLGESVLFTALALLLAVVLCESVLPVFKALSGKSIATPLLADGTILLSLIGIGAAVGLAAGLYPAFVLSSFRPIHVLKGPPSSGSRKGTGLRSSLVVFQFTVSTLLILGTTVVYYQLSFIRAKSLGANIDQVVVIPYSDSVVPLISEMRQNPTILGATASSRVPVNIDSWDTRPILVEGFDKPIQMENYNIDEHFLSAYQIELVAGRNLPEGLSADSSAMLVNRAAVEQFGWRSPEEAIGKRLGWQNGYRWGHIVGVVEDFHLGSMREAITPLVMIKLRENFWYNFISVRLRPQDVSETLAFIETTWRKFTPAGGYQYFFVDDSFAALHRADERFGQIVAVFAVMSIVISCLGLLGLAAFAAEHRTKEIGLRKVLGASVASVVGLLSRDVVKLVLLANLFAWPLAWFAMNTWLQSFAYRVEISWWVFALVGGLALSIALLTVSTQVIRAALANPVKSLRYE